MFETTFNCLEELFTKFQIVATEPKIDKEVRKKQMMVLFFKFVSSLMNLPIKTKELQLKGIELIGDLLRDFSDHKNAIFYYSQAVITSM